MWWLKKKQLSAAPSGVRIYAIGDIHGCLSQLQSLRQKIDDDAEAAPEARRVLVYIGDYVDRGGGSRAVLDYLLADAAPGLRVVHLKGNYEDYMLRFFQGDLEAGAGWIANGGDATLASYGIEVSSLWPEFSELKQLQSEFVSAAPEAHIAFLNSLPDRHVEGGYAFVHAGVAPGVALSDQKEEDLLWIRKRFLDSNALHD
ncbi:MAG: serine/threonine protein phosphatase 1 [Alphaproteobacteria bacterium]|jgi:serine/threonine protein phosphatase 1